LRQGEAARTARGQQFYSVEAAGFELPSQVILGIAYERNISDDSRVLLISSFENNNFANDEYKLAAEFAFQETFFIRGGYSHMPAPEEEQTFGPTFGAGFNIDTGINITVDYAYRWARFFDANHMFSMKLGF
jgi:hypothetical protein